MRALALFRRADLSAIVRRPGVSVPLTRIGLTGVSNFDLNVVTAPFGVDSVVPFTSFALEGVPRAFGGRPRLFGVGAGGMSGSPSSSSCTSSSRLVLSGLLPLASSCCGARSSSGSGSGWGEVLRRLDGLDCTWVSSDPVCWNLLGKLRVRVLRLCLGPSSLAAGFLGILGEYIVQRL